MHTSKLQFAAAACAAALWLGWSASTIAAVPQSIQYQGYLTHADGSPVDAPVNVTFVAYDVEVGGAPLWTQTDTLSVAQGLFTATLANPVNPFPAGLFDGPVYIGLFVAGEEMLPRRALSSNAYAFKASDADTLNGLDAAALNQSAEVAALDGEVDAVQGDISALQGDVGGVALDVAALSGTVSSVQTDVGANAAGLASLQGEVNTNAARIVNIESVGADITGVSAGSGLVGGGIAGNVSLGIGSGAVTGDMVQDGSIGPQDIVSSANYSMQALALSDRLTLETDDGGLLSVNSNAFGSGLWWQDESDNELGRVLSDNLGIYVSSGSAGILVDARRDGRLGLGGAIPSTSGGYTVAVPNLDVQGTINIGLQTEIQSFALDSFNAGCLTYGGDPCYQGSADAVCPVGTKVLGGGVSGVFGAFSSIASSYPVSESAWRCRAAHFQSGRTEFCYAICADVE